MAVKADDDLLPAVRTALQEQLGIEAFTPAPLRRITLGSAVNLFGSLVLVACCSPSSPTFGSIIDALQEADCRECPSSSSSWRSRNVAGAMSLMGAVDAPLPFLTTTEVMLSGSRS